MLEERQLREITKRIKKLTDEGLIQTKQKSEYVDFFIKNSEDSLQSAQCLISQQKKIIQVMKT